MKAKHQIVQGLTAGQMKDLTAAVVESIPTNLSSTEAQYWIGKKGKLAGEIRKIFSVNANLFSKLLAKWEEFYKSIYGRKQDFSGMVIPDAEEIFSWITYIPGEMPTGEAYKGLEKLHSTWKWTNSPLDDVLDLSFGRDARKDNYIVRYRPNAEADEDLKNFSANMVAERKINTSTLKERILLGGFLYWSEKIILDQKTITLCAGSRYSGGDVPHVRWHGGRLHVHWCPPGSCYDPLRPRQAVSN